MRAHVALPAAVLGVATALAVATGCGVQSNDTGSNRTTAFTQTTTTPTTQTTATVTVPQRPSGTVAIDVLTGDPITKQAISGFTATSSTSIVRAVGTDTANFGDLCAGRVDVITTTREPSAAEIASCKAHGLNLASPMQAASDGVVLATKNASDVGGDCIDVRQARDIFKAGSQYANWNQLGFDDLPLRTVGRDQGSDSFQLFGQIVLGIPDPTIGDVRADYLARPSDRAERETVTGAAVLRAARARIAAYTKKLKAETRGPRQVYIDKEIAIANAHALKVIDAINARNKKNQVIVDAETLIARNAAYVTRVKNAAGARAARRYDARIDKQIAAYTQRALRNTGQRGFVGPFDFSYYGLYEDQLRPLEIDYGVPETKSGQPVRFEDLSDADQIALAKSIGTATGQTTPNPAATQTVTTTTKTTTNANTSTVTTVPAKPQPAYKIAPSTIVPKLDGLPKTTRTGDVIYPGPNCVFPSALTITNGSYPLARHVFLYTTDQALDRSDVQDFLEYYVEHAQQLARTYDLIPITNIQRDDALAIIAGKPQPKASIINGTEATVTTRTTVTPGQGGGVTTVPGTGQGGTETPRTTQTTQTTQTTTTPADAGTSSGIPGVSSGAGQ